MLALTIWEWLHTWYFAVILLAICFSILVITYIERQDRRGVCPTCGSQRKRVRLRVRYWMSDYISYDSICEDYWHD